MVYKKEEYLSPKQTAERFNFTLPSLRWFLFHRHANGLDKAVIKIGTKGGRLVINTARFRDWLEEHREA